MKITSNQSIRKLTQQVTALVALLAAPAVFAASQTWSNAPSSSAWTNAANWNGNGVPGALNSSTIADIASFVSPISLAGYGGTGQPITNDLLRGIRSLRFDTVECGAYVFGNVLEDNHLELAHLGDISIGVAVTNPIVFKQGLRLRVPSSTNQRFDFTNNAVDPNATLYFTVISNGTANTRPWNVFLGGANTGTNTIARIDSSGNTVTPGTTGAILLDKVGTGTWILSGPNDLPQKTSAGNIARVQVVDGTLIVKDVASLGAISAANLLITNTGVLQIDGITPQNLGMSLRSGGTIRMNGTGGINGLVVGNQVGVTGVVSVVSASDVFTIGGPSVVSGGAADSMVRTLGTGTIQLAAANTYVGNWSFEAATNQLTTTALNGSRNVHVAAGAILDVSILSFYSLESLSLSANGTGTVVGSSAATITAGPAGTFDLNTKAINLTYAPVSFSGDATRPALYVADGTISLSGNQFNINNASGTPLGAGTYRLIQQASGVVTASGGSFAIVTGAGLAAGNIGEIQVAGGNVNLVVSPHAVANLSWQGGNPDSTWDNNTTANWFNGIGLVPFVTSDAVTFDGTGIANPTVSLATTLLPGSVRADTTAGDYTFSGAGQLAGPTALTKVGANALVLQTVNTYLGGTTVSNGTLRVGIDNAISSSGAGNVSVYSPAIIDVNNFSNTVNGLIGDGTVDNLGGGAGTIAIGNNNAASTFTGDFKNSTGILGLTKLGTGTLTISKAQTYSGLTTVNGGTLRVNHYNGLGSGQTNVFVNTGGTLNITTNVVIAGLSGTGGFVNNNSATAPSTITLQGNGDYTGAIGNGPANAGISLFIKSGTTRLNGVNTYSNGTVIASGATLALGVINPGGSGQAGTGGIIASNGAVISLPSNVSTSSGLGNNVTNIDAGGTVYFPSAGQANGYNGQFYGGANNTNVFSGPMSIGGVITFSNFLGTVVISNGASVRWFNANGGGDNTIFDVRGNTFSRDPNTIRFGALIGDGAITAPSTPIGTFLIGAKGLNTTFSGGISGSNNIVKVGGGSLTLDGRAYYTNVVTLPDPNEPTNIVSFTLFSNRVTYVNATTVSNGTLKIVAPNNLTNSASITLAGATAVLDASQIGYATNQTMIDYNLVEQATNTVVVTTATVEILATQSLNGVGGIIGSVRADIGSAINAGLPVGTLTVTGNLDINGAVNMNLNRTNLAQNSSRIIAGSFSGSGATLTVTNVGPTLLSGSTYQLFNGPVSMFTTVNLPATDVTGQIAYVWQNDVAVNGTITLTTGLNTTPTTIISTPTGTNTLVLAWPQDHTGWTLQNQTNTLNVGISTNWFNVAASTTTNSVIVPVVRTNATVFYRLNLPLP